MLVILIVAFTAMFLDGSPMASPVTPPCPRRRVNLAEANAHLSELVAQAETGEAIQISRRGKPLAQLTSLTPLRTPIDVAGMQALTDSMPDCGVDSAVLTMRDEARY